MPPPAKAHTCVGCTHYSRELHAAGREPVCIGLRGSRALDDGPIEAVPLPPDVAAGGPFSSLCIGYAAWPPRDAAGDAAGSRPRPSDDDAGVPQCMGVQIIRAQAVAAAPALAGADGGQGPPPPPPRAPQPQRSTARSPPTPAGGDAADTLLDRFERSAAKVLRRMGENAAAALEAVTGGGGRD